MAGQNRGRGGEDEGGSEGKEISGRKVENLLMMIQNRLNESRTTGNANQTNRGELPAVGTKTKTDLTGLIWSGMESAIPFFVPGDLSHSRDLIHSAILRLVGSSPGRSWLYK